jgi:hypothetical protein
MTGPNETILSIPRGTPSQAPLRIDLSPVHLVEQRLSETKVANLATAIELRASFNEACSLVTKYLAWIRFEILMSKKHLDLAKAEVIIDKYPGFLKEIKEQGIKDNADLRQAYINRDPAYLERLDNLNHLLTVEELLESKVKTFERAYWDCRHIAEARGRTAALPNYPANDGQLLLPQNNFMGLNEKK